MQVLTILELRHQPVDRVLVEQWRHHVIECRRVRLAIGAQGVSWGALGQRQGAVCAGPGIAWQGDQAVGADGMAWRMAQGAAGIDDPIN